LRLPWGWDGGDGGPIETNWRADPNELHNKQVEPIIRKYLELRYRLLPYTYTVAKESCETGLPMIRSLWLHYPQDAAAVARGDQFLWGRDILVAPVVEKGATSRRVYLPKGSWFDYWTEERIEGGREIDRPVDLETLPLYVRAGAIVPHAPVREYTEQQTSEPMTVMVYPGADAAITLYEDDGRSFDYRQGKQMRLAMRWNDAAKRLSISLAPRSQMLPPPTRPLRVRVAGTKEEKAIEFAGKPIEVHF